MKYYDKKGNPHMMDFDGYRATLQTRQAATRTNAGRRLAGRTDFIDVPEKPPELCACIAYINGDYMGRINHPDEAPDGAALKFEPATR